MAFPVPAPAPTPTGDATAVVGRRVVAALVDAALVLIPAFLLLTASFEYLEVDALDRDPQQYCDDYLDAFGGLCIDLSEVNDRVYFSDGADATATVFYWGATFALLVVLQGLTGWTPGKLLTGIRTVGADGRAPGVGRALVRWLLWVVDGFPYVMPLLGFVLALTTTGHRRLGDMAAKTFVIRAGAAGQPVAVAGLTDLPPGVVGAPDSFAASSPVATAGPQWDAARGTYIQWDPSGGRWMQWDETTRAWTPIAGQ